MRKSNKLFLLNIFLSVIFLFGLYFFDKIIGGNATNGKIENSIFYVQDSLGNFNEVSKCLYIVNYFYTCITVLHILSGAVSFPILQYRFLNFCKERKDKKC